MNTEKIRSRQQEYHAECYKNNMLYEEGSWLQKPIKTVVSLMDEFLGVSNVKILDLGCGVGRNSIYMAKQVKKDDGLIVCVDLLDTAIEQLEMNAIKYGVANNIVMYKADIEKFLIEEESYNGIIAVSALEHLSDVKVLISRLNDMRRGTKADGVNCIVINSNIREYLIESCNELTPQFEINLSKEDIQNLLVDIYDDWKVLKYQVNHYKFEVERQEGPVIIETDCITYVVKNG